MKRILIVPALFAVLALGGCAGLKSAVETVTTTITNPINSTDIYRIKNVYAATLQLAVEYRQYCWARSYAVLMADIVAKPLCQNRRVVVRAMQVARPKAASAIRSADSFVRNNPTLNAGTVISAAWAAVTDFQNSVPKVK